MIPPSERSQDQERSTHDLVNEVSRPLTDEERKAADRDVPVAERVYAPASERVPREPVPGHRDFVEHPDPATPERQAAAVSSPIAAPATQSSSAEPAFTRVPRPSSDPSETHNERWMSAPPALFPMSIGWAVCCGVGIWLFMRWRRERNKPLNRIRRQAEQARRTAYELRERMPDIPDEAARPAMGLGTVLLSLAVFLWQQSQARSRSEMAQAQMKSTPRDARKRADKASKQASKYGRKAAQAVADSDWQERLMQLKERWNPSRLELEKMSIPRR
jgi:hypothetical protein